MMTMHKDDLAFLMAVAGTACWGICFAWMHRISAKQNRLLDKLGDQGKRIEKLSRLEHDLIKEVHPKVSEIQEGMTEVLAAVKENTEALTGETPEPAGAARKSEP